MHMTSNVAAAAAFLLTTAVSTAFAAQSGPDFVKTAIQGDDAEIMMGQLAEQKGSTADVRSFGQTLVRDHTTAKQEMMDVARQLKVQPSDTANPDAEAVKAKLSGLTGLAFDGAFADAMVNDHEKDIAEYREEANAKSGPASTMAAKQLPVLEKHLRMAQDIRKSMAGGALAADTGAATGFLAEEGDRWRGSKLIGVDVYGPNNQKVGDINDLLVGRDGKVDDVVIGVGGFLGIGEKNVAIPFDRVTFSQEPMMATGQARTGGMAANNAVAPGGITGPAPAAGPAGQMTATSVPAVPVNQPAAAGASVAPRARSMAYPDHGLIDYTADQLKSAPTFQYAQ